MLRPFLKKGPKKLDSTRNSEFLGPFLKNSIPLAILSFLGPFFKKGQVDEAPPACLGPPILAYNPYSRPRLPYRAILRP
jgi:hypothetical protein